MARTMTGNAPTGLTCYFREWDDSLPEKIRSGSTYVSYAGANYANYIRSATEIGTTGRYNADAEALVGARRYELLQQVGGSPSVANDFVLDRGEFPVEISNTQDVEIIEQDVEIFS